MMASCHKGWKTLRSISSFLSFQTKTHYKVELMHKNCNIKKIVYFVASTLRSEVAVTRFLSWIDACNLLDEAEINEVKGRTNIFEKIYVTFIHIYRRPGGTEYFVEALEKLCNLDGDLMATSADIRVGLVNEFSNWISITQTRCNDSPVHQHSSHEELREHLTGKNDSFAYDIEINNVREVGVFHETICNTFEIASECDPRQTENCEYENECFSSDTLLANKSHTVNMEEDMVSDVENCSPELRRGKSIEKLSNVASSTKKGSNRPIKKTGRQSKHNKKGSRKPCSFSKTAKRVTGWGIAVSTVGVVAYWATGYLGSCGGTSASFSGGITNISSRVPTTYGPSGFMPPRVRGIKIGNDIFNDTIYIGLPS